MSERLPADQKKRMRMIAEAQIAADQVLDQLILPHDIVALLDALEAAQAAALQPGQVAVAEEGLRESLLEGFASQPLRYCFWTTRFGLAEQPTAEPEVQDGKA